MSRQQESGRIRIKKTAETRRRRRGKRRELDDLARGSPPEDSVRWIESELDGEEGGAYDWRDSSSSDEG